MRKTFLIVISCFSIACTLMAGETFSISLSGKYLVPADRNFKDVYGNTLVLPEIKVDINILKNLYLWAGFGISTSKGTTVPDLKENIEFTQNIISGGAGYCIRMFPKIHFFVEGGTAYFNCREKIPDLEIKSTALGYSVAGGVNIYLGKIIMTRIAGGFISASDNVESEDVKLGGAFGSLGLGFRF